MNSTDIASRPSKDYALGQWKTAGSSPKQHILEKVSLGILVLKTECEKDGPHKVKDAKPMKRLSLRPVEIVTIIQRLVTILSVVGLLFRLIYSFDPCTTFF